MASSRDVRATRSTRRKPPSRCARSTTASLSSPSPRRPIAGRRGSLRGRVAGSASIPPMSAQCLGCSRWLGSLTILPTTTARLMLLLTLLWPRQSHPRPPHPRTSNDIRTHRRARRRVGAANLRFFLAKNVCGRRRRDPSLAAGVRTGFAPQVRGSQVPTHRSRARPNAHTVFAGRHTCLAISSARSRSTTAMSYWPSRSSQNCARLPK